MSKPTFLALTCVLLATGAAVANRALPHMSKAVLRPVHIEAFPKTLDGWTATTERPYTMSVLPNARMLDRDYEDAQGHTVQQLLLTSKTYGEFHDPSICMPAQGFKISPLKVVTLPGTKQQAYLMTATLREQNFQVLYWWPSHEVYNNKRNDVWAKAMTLRERISGQDGRALFVRFITPVGPGSDQRLMKLAAKWEPQYEALPHDPAPLVSQKN